MDLRDKIPFEPPGIGCALSLTGLPGGGGIIYDRGPYGNMGTIVGASWARLPCGLWCLSFDGVDDLVNCGNEASLQIDGKLTLEVWYKPLGNASANNAHIAGRGQFRIYQPTSTSPTAIKSYLQTDQGALFVNYNALTLTEWHHLVVAYDNSLASDNSKVYQNGLAVNSGDRQGTLSSTTDDWYLGGGVAGQVNGIIALVRVYNRVLSALEIQNHFNREKYLFGAW